MNIFDLPPLPLSEEAIQILCENNHFRAERIISTGQTTGWYDQTETEFVILLSGSAKIEYENGRILDLSRGDTLLLPPHEKHRVAYTSAEPPCVWLCLFYA